MNVVQNKIVFEIQKIYVLMNLLKDLELDILESARKIYKLFEEDDEPETLQDTVMKFLKCNREDAVRLIDCVDIMGCEASSYKNLLFKLGTMRQYGEEIWYKIYSVRECGP